MLWYMHGEQASINAKRINRLSGSSVAVLDAHINIGVPWFLYMHLRAQRQQGGSQRMCRSIVEVLKCSRATAICNYKYVAYLDTDPRDVRCNCWVKTATMHGIYLKWEFLGNGDPEVDDITILHTC